MYIHLRFLKGFWKACSNTCCSWGLHQQIHGSWKWNRPNTQHQQSLAVYFFVISTGEHMSECISLCHMYCPKCFFCSSSHVGDLFNQNGNMSKILRPRVKRGAKKKSTGHDRPFHPYGGQRPPLRRGRRFAIGGGLGSAVGVDGSHRWFFLFNGTAWGKQTFKAKQQKNSKRQQNPEKNRIVRNCLFVVRCGSNDSILYSHIPEAGDFGRHWTVGSSLQSGRRHNVQISIAWQQFCPVGVAKNPRLKNMCTSNATVA